MTLPPASGRGHVADVPPGRFWSYLRMKPSTSCSLQRAWRRPDFMTISRKRDSTRSP